MQDPVSMSITTFTAVQGVAQLQRGGLLRQAIDSIDNGKMNDFNRLALQLRQTRGIGFTSRDKEIFVAIYEGFRKEASALLQRRGGFDFLNNEERLGYQRLNLLMDLFNDIGLRPRARGCRERRE